MSPLLDIIEEMKKCKLNRCGLRCVILNKKKGAKKICELEESGQLARKAENSLQFQDRPAGGAIWSFDCFITDNVITANISCNSDIQENEDWIVKAELRFMAGPYPSSLPYQECIYVKFSSFQPTVQITLETPMDAMDGVDFCKIIIKTDYYITGREDRRCWWYEPRIPKNSFSTSIQIRDQRFYFFPFPYVQHLKNMNRERSNLVLHGCSVETYLMLLNWHEFTGPYPELCDMDEDAFEIFVAGAMYFEYNQENLRKFLIREAVEKFGVTKAYTWMQLAGDDEYKQMFHTRHEKDITLRYPNFLRNREMGIGNARFRRH